ncbi:hypothetical protein PRIPAC_78206 [Pristionchus pacificus]|uniref:Uncharacterized protein n=1 Tax=Pristionchus pacificus TaxID=54126 RepID=A0A2A6BWS4_PRIPA|nr:hypothetical protein PRIPAC_78206 [Pristionchus pacificus]|eukprot:PDM70452.1 hypothetical protein PRIPAC_46698 [Pristionchus pacificus]
MDKYAANVLNGLFVGLIDDVFGGGDDLFRGERRREELVGSENKGTGLCTMGDVCLTRSRISWVRDSNWTLQQRMNGKKTRNEEGGWREERRSEKRKEVGP